MLKGHFCRFLPPVARPALVSGRRILFLGDSYANGFGNAGKAMAPLPSFIRFQLLRPFLIANYINWINMHNWARSFLQTIFWTSIQVPTKCHGYRLCQKGGRETAARACLLVGLPSIFWKKFLQTFSVAGPGLTFRIFLLGETFLLFSISTAFS